MTSVPAPIPVPDALAAAVDAPVALLGLGMPRCGACLLLPASLAEVVRVRPGLTAVMGEFRDLADWRLREELLWPRGIHVSRSSVPAMALLRAGEVVATRSGGGPAHVIDAWLTPHLGPAAHALPEAPTPAEHAAFAEAGPRIAQQRAVKRERAGG
ncbi:MAG: hypothetical protein RIB67_03615 [Miltoncostaeaceae bacterium]